MFTRSKRNIIEILLNFCDMFSSKVLGLNIYNDIKEKLFEFIHNKDTFFTKAEIKHFVSHEIRVEVK